ncbi:MAG TPA: hypothetical protein PLZ77_09805 [Lachnospiraceae bacterium]|nr:hypothetical protein [Lachnospiraceae bacterium]HPF30379.1 hypothetical protein [Lachnospiraceae bacterium]
MKLFNASRMITEENIGELLRASSEPDKFEEMIKSIKHSFLESYQFKVYGTPADFTEQSYVIATNHLTDSDAPLIMSYHCKMMSSVDADYERLFVFAKENCFNGVSVPRELVPVLQHENVVGVDRNSLAGSMAALKTAVRWYQKDEKVKHFLIFAQGTIYDINKDKAEDIENGAFWIAKQLNIPVLPAFLEQMVEGEENRMVFAQPIEIPKSCRDYTEYRELWMQRVIEAQNSLEKITGRPARTVVLDQEHQVRKKKAEK